MSSLGKRKAPLERTGTFAVDPDDPDATVPSSETFLEPEEPAAKKAKPGSREKLKYATTTVIRSLDGSGASSVSLMSTLRSASFHTRKVLQQQLLNEQKKITPEVKLAKKVLGLLAKSFVEVEGYDYEPKSASHKWKTKKNIKEFQDLLIPLTEAATKVLKEDTMLVKLQSPTYVLGDLHGNYKDLQFFKKSFWNMGIDMSPARFLFLGDYVDRGPHSVELCAYLFGLKILFPTRVFLLRGNHEFRAQNGERDYDPCFLQNCEALFRKAQAKKIWDEFNNAFEYMPLAATIDDKIFCCHGGIPRIIQNELADNPLVRLIDEIPRPLNDDQVDQAEDFIAMDLLWADPATQEEESNTEDGWFGVNERGGDIIVFGERAVQEFIKHTGCTHLIRAHQPPKHGIEYCKSARIVTVFSSSHYCGGFNSAAIVLVNEGRLRVATTKPVVPADNVSDESEEEDDVIAEESY